ncbi:hypothetical protein MKZ38_004365 [Zalerion maritima]|uniref:DUF2293 domain-containing protein n=1 Tax=Zalerion maritima TaxID=339359 RepID=A0AAD5RMB1_9PEZI|nr:hypothetical protein MKZ38_004365 [Zalerion maritima]
MGRERKTKQQPANTGKERHRQDARPLPKKIQNTASLMPSQPLKALKDAQKYKYTSRFEWVENKDKKDRRINLILSKTENSTNADRPRGNSPTSEDEDESILEQLKDYKSQMTRLGYHFREQVVNQVKREEHLDSTFPWVTIQQNEAGDIIPEPLPDNQADIYRQADQVICDLFPRIPNTDRAQLITHAFNKSAPTFRGDQKVGLATDIVLSRRCALAVLAHIRHTHTRYDELLRESNYIQARKAVQEPCLDILVKWRGDEETGRDIASEVLRELVVIDDESETERSDDEGPDDSDVSDATQDVTPSPQLSPAANATPFPLVSTLARATSFAPSSVRTQDKLAQHVTATGHIRKPSRNFRRYEQLERKYGAEESAYKERLFGTAMHSALAPSRAGSYCTPPLPLAVAPHHRSQASADITFARSIPHPANDPATHRYTQGSYGEASAFSIPVGHSRQTMETGICPQADPSSVLGPRRYDSDRFAIDRQTMPARSQRPVLVRERVRFDPDGYRQSHGHSTVAAADPVPARQTSLSAHLLEDMLVPSVEPTSPSVHTTMYQAPGTINHRQLDVRQDRHAPIQSSRPHETPNVEYRPVHRQGPSCHSRYVEPPYAGGHIAQREAHIRTIPIPARDNSGQSALDTMGFIQIHRNKQEFPVYATHGHQQRSQHMYSEGREGLDTPTHQSLGNQRHRRDEAAPSVLVQRRPTGRTIQQSRELSSLPTDDCNTWTSRSRINRARHTVAPGYPPHGHIPGRDGRGAMAPASEPHYVPRPRELVIIDSPTAA